MKDLGAILTAMATPFDERGGVDEDGAVRLANHLLENGSDGLVVGGTTGEAATMTDDEHIGLVGLIVGETKGRGTVVAGTGSNDTHHACTLTERAVEAGVDAVLSVTPYYNKPSRRGLMRHFEEVAKAAGGTPVILYNIPSRTALDMPNDLLAELAQIDGIEGVKQANDDALALVEGLVLYAGNDTVLCRTLELGGAGGICVSSHLVGNEMRRMVDEPEQRRAIDASLRDVYETLFMPRTSSPGPLKAALSMLGLPAGGLRLPLVEPEEHEVAKVRAMLERHGLLAPART